MVPDEECRCAGRGHWAAAPLSGDWRTRRPRPLPVFRHGVLCRGPFRERAARATALAFYAERGRDGWHSTHPVLPPPASPSAYFEELSWQKSIFTPGAIEAPFRLLIVDVGEAAGKKTAGLRQLLTMLVTLPGLDIYCVTDGVMESIQRVAILDLSRPDLASFDKSVVLD